MEVSGHLHTSAALPAGERAPVTHGIGGWVAGEPVWTLQIYIRGCVQKLPDCVDNEINKNKHSLRSNTKGYGGKTH